MSKCKMSEPQDDFEKYLKRLELNNSFMNIDLSQFSWYRKILANAKEMGVHCGK